MNIAAGRVPNTIQIKTTINAIIEYIFELCILLTIKYNNQHVKDGMIYNAYIKYNIADIIMISLLIFSLSYINYIEMMSWINSNSSYYFLN